MPVPPAPSPAPNVSFASRREAGFTLVEMLVAMLLLSLVGLTLARFQTFQLAGTASITQAAAARLVADNLAIDVLAAPQAPTGTLSGELQNMGRNWHWSIHPEPAPPVQLGQTGFDSAQLGHLVAVRIHVAPSPDTPPLVSRHLLRPANLLQKQPVGTANGRANPASGAEMIGQ